MKRILGLDLGVASIGWAVVNVPDSYCNNDMELQAGCQELISNQTKETSKPSRDTGNESNPEISIEGLGCLLINNSSETLREFQKGIGESPNTHRALLRNQRNRRRNARARRIRLINFLTEHHMLPESLNHDRIHLWQLRCKAPTQQLDLEDLGRVLIHLSQKRGHISGNKVDQGMTIGEYVFQNLSHDPTFRAKGLEFSRTEHIRELETILKNQSIYYPEIFTPENTYSLIHKIIFFEKRRENVAATKRLCDLEKKERKKILERSDKKQPKRYAPQAAFRSNPLFQSFNTLSQLQLLRLHTSRNTEPRPLSKEETYKLFDYLQVNASITLKEIPAFLGMGKSVRCSKVEHPTELPVHTSSYRRKITGNQTYILLRNILGEKYLHLLTFEIPFNDAIASKKSSYINIEPSSINNKEYDPEHLISNRSVISENIIEEPLYKLWRNIFAHLDKKALDKVLLRKYHIQEAEIREKLCNLNLYSYGFSNVSVKAIRSLMPMMFEGTPLLEACQKLGYAQKNLEKEIEERGKQGYEKKMMPPLAPIEINNPIVKKDLNKLITLVNKLLLEYGPFDRIHIELARELGMSSTQRQEYYLLSLRNEQENLRNTKKLQSMGILVTQKALYRFRLWDETDGRCIYCGERIPKREYLIGTVGEVEHIIPRSLQFNDSFNNKACSCRRCNQAKGSMTAYDYFKSLGERTLKVFTERVESLYRKHKISKQKKENLLTKTSDLVDEFISSQLVASRYISSKALEMLSKVCPVVMPTNGIFTSFLRNKWGYDNILHDLNLPYYRLLSKVEDSSSSEANPNAKKSEKIQGWSKRLDHRHHCVDALVIALTSNDFTEGIRHLNDRVKSSKTSVNARDRISSDKLALSQLRPCVSEVTKALEKVIVVHSTNEDKVRWSYRNTEHGHIRTLTPKAALHRESIYGEITRVDAKGKRCGMKVVRVPLDEIDSEKKILRVVDPQLRSIIQSEFGKAKDNKKLKEEKDDQVVIEETDSSTSPSGIYSDNEILKGVRAVRSFSYHQNLTPLRYNENGEAIGFVRTDNNHHVSIYSLPNGKMVEKVVSFFDYAKLRRLGLHGVIIDPKTHCDDVSRKNIILDSVLQKCIPPKDAEHVLTLMKNQLYILGLTQDQIKQAFEKEDFVFLSKHISRVQGISSCNYRFALHTQSETSLKNFNRPDGRFLLYSSLSKFLAANPTRVIVDTIGRLRLLQI